ncbi:MAG: hypothetical protein IKR57_01245 [Bacilli bacterium]|nr:hypothetical protein [Bacilli bacterium]
MYKYYKAYKMGFNKGLNDAIRYNKKKRFKVVNDKELLSKLYDIGYIEGYSKYMNYSAFNSKKNIV